jgi:hypothetical protein
LVASGVEVAAPLEPEPAVLEPAAVELAEEVSAAEEEDSTALELPVAEALVSAGAELEELDSVALALEALLVVTGGTEMGWPAEEHWPTTALETAGLVLVDGLDWSRVQINVQTWSGTEQASFTQGVMVLTREVFWQWQLKSSSSEQPSPPRAVRKHCS